MRRRRLSIPPIVPVLAVLLLAPLALASDGALEIHQACVAGGCFPGDPPGFPVLIAENGSYVLTSNLQVPDENTTAIRVTAEFATVDLGGFVISGVTQCGGFPPVCSPAGNGVGVEVDAGPGVVQAVSVRNGMITGMGSDGVGGLGKASVERLTVYLNGGRGIAAQRARDNRVSGNAGIGIEALESVVGNGVAFNHAAGISCIGATLVRGDTVSTNGIVTDGPGDPVPGGHGPRQPGLRQLGGGSRGRGRVHGGLRQQRLSGQRRPCNPRQPGDRPGHPDGAERLRGGTVSVSRRDPCKELVA
jgi:hypothetical protein